jgi:tetratricopeptide (TPR) repeat protein
MNRYLSTVPKIDLTIRPEDSQHDRLYKQAIALIGPNLTAPGKSRGYVGFFLKRKLRKAVVLLTEVIQINPDNWPAMWLAGRACRRLGDNAIALKFFARGCEVPGSDADLPRDAGITAMDLGQPGEAVEFLNEAIALRPDDAALVTNLALAHLFNQNPQEAKRVADYALHVAPRDAVNQQIVELVDAVLAGQRPCPHNAREIRKPVAV